MKRDYDKPTAKKSRVEIELTEVFDHIASLESKLQKLETVVDDLYFKASISHCLLVVEKTSEDTLKALNLLKGEAEP